MITHRIPMSARLIETIHGIDVNDAVITCKVYRHRRRGQYYENHQVEHAGYPRGR